MSKQRGQLTQRYESLVSAGTIYQDSAQYEMIQRLDSLTTQILSSNSKLQKVLSSVGIIKNPKGLYLWGGVGRGKTFVMDMFFDALPLKAKSGLSSDWRKHLTNWDACRRCIDGLSHAPQSR